MTEPKLNDDQKAVLQFLVKDDMTSYHLRAIAEGTGLTYQQVSNACNRLVGKKCINHTGRGQYSKSPTPKFFKDASVEYRRKHGQKKVQKLGKNQVKVLEFLTEKGTAMKVGEIAKALDMGAGNASTVLKSLLGKKLIARTEATNSYHAVQKPGKAKKVTDPEPRKQEAENRIAGFTGKLADLPKIITHRDQLINQLEGLGKEYDELEKQFNLQVQNLEVRKKVIDEEIVALNTTIKEITKVD